MTHTLLVYMHSGKIIRLDYSKASEAWDALNTFAFSESDGVRVADDFGSYAIRLDNVAFVKMIQEEEDN